VGLPRPPHTFIKHSLSLHTPHTTQINCEVRRGQGGGRERETEREGEREGERERDGESNIANRHNMGPWCFLWTDKEGKLQRMLTPTVDGRRLRG